MISIIVPVYNSSKVLEKCIDSILAQTYKSFELILIDDGSSDGSGKICDKYADIDDRLKVYHRANYGVSASRNFGTEKAKGEWISFIDSDDYIDTTYLESFFPNNLIESDLVFQGIRISDHTGNVIQTLKYDNVNIYLTGERERGGGKIIDKYELFQNRGPYSKLYNRHVINKNNIKFDEAISIAEDGIFFYSYLLTVKQLILKSNVGYNYIKYGSLSLSTKRHKYEEWERVYKLYYSISQQLYGSLDMLSSHSYRSKLTDIVTYRTTGVFLQMYRLGYEKKYRLDIINSILKDRENIWPLQYRTRKRSFYEIIFKSIPNAIIIDYFMTTLKFLHLF